MARRVRIPLWILVLHLLVFALLAEAMLACAGEEFTGRCVGVTDGDTVIVLREGKAVRVRLYGIDAPEKRQPYGTQAKQFTASLVFAQDVRVIVHSTDRYGRLIGEVILPSHHSLSVDLVGAGYAWWYRQYARHDTTLAMLERDAQEGKRGLWADAQPVAPWDWRKGKRQ